MADKIQRFTTANSFVAEIGSCIYCLHRNTTNLGREHVIPFSLGGGIVLRAASCKKHEKITKRFEEDISQITMAKFRYVRGLPSYNKKNWPKSLQVLIKEGTSLEHREIPISQYPDMLPIPAFDDLPGMLTGAKPGPVKTTLRLYHNKGNLLTRAREQTPRGELILDGVFHVASFIRLIAKIAHGAAIAQYGFGFTPFLLKIIEGDISDAGFLIGRSPKIFEQTKVSNAHIIATEIIDDGDISYVLAHIGLFSGLGPPVSTAIVGCFETAHPPVAPPWRK